MNNRSTPFVSVIIPVYNDPQRLQSCLQALAGQTYPSSSSEVLVVDNGSDESITPLVSEFPHAQASYEPQRSSYAARNKGVTLAQGEVLAFTDADCIPAPDWIERGVATLLKTPRCGIVGGNIEFFFKDPHRPNAFEIWDSLTCFPQQFHIEQQKFSVTANLFTWRQVFDQVGNFDQHLHSGGDYQWGQRVAAAGYALIYAPDVCIKHPARHSFKSLRNRMVRTAGGMETVRKKNGLVFNRINPAPSFATLFRIWRNAQLTFLQKGQVTVVGLGMKYIEIWERVHARFHAE